MKPLFFGLVMLLAMPMSLLAQDADSLVRVAFEQANAHYDAGRYAEAAEGYRHAAEKGYAKAAYNLAFCYMYGKGVPCDYEQALEWLKKSANAGFSQAMVTLSECYEQGILVEQNLEESRRWKQMSMVKREKKEDRKDLKEVKVAEVKEKQDVKVVEEMPEVKEEEVADGLPVFDIKLDGDLHERVPLPEEQPMNNMEPTPPPREPLLPHMPGTKPRKKLPDNFQQPVNAKKTDDSPKPKVVQPSNNKRDDVEVIINGSQRIVTRHK